jgi:hypothetical protein
MVRTKLAPVAQPFQKHGITKEDQSTTIGAMSHEPGIFQFEDG